jgi:Zn-finger nucleic acid-binding protein
MGRAAGKLAALFFMPKPPAIPPQGVACPECTKPCAALNCGPVVVDFCRPCGGIWFDDREIGMFRAKLREFDLTKLRRSELPAVGYAPSISSCPRCSVLLETFVYGVNTKVKPQRCPRCHGIWLDAVQLKGFLSLARLSQEIEPHVRGLAHALEDERKEKEKWDRIGEFGDTLNRHLRYSRWRDIWWFNWFRRWF